MTSAEDDSQAEQDDLVDVREVEPARSDVFPDRVVRGACGSGRVGSPDGPEGGLKFVATPKKNEAIQFNVRHDFSFTLEGECGPVATLRERLAVVSVEDIPLTPGCGSGSDAAASESGPCVDVVVVGPGEVDGSLKYVIILIVLRVACLIQVWFLFSFSRR